MPKDITHWAIADEISKRIEDQRAKEIVQKYKSLYYLGAMSIDIPYYDLFVNPKKINAIGDRLHEPGREANTLKPLINVMQGYKNLPEYVLPFVIGAIAHIAADCTFHPMIYYYTGNYYDKDEYKRELAVIRHRYFETMLDLYIKDEQKYDDSVIAATFFFWKRITSAAFINLLRLEYFSELNNLSVMLTLCEYLTIQRILNSKFMFSILEAIGKVFKINNEKHTAVFYHKIVKGDLEFFEGKIEYLHPVTGEVFNESIGEMKQKAVDMALEIINAVLETDVSNLDKIVTPSLETGLIGYTHDDMKYFKGHHELFGKSLSK